MIYWQAQETKKFNLHRKSDCFGIFQSGDVGFSPSAQVVVPKMSTMFHLAHKKFPSCSMLQVQWSQTTARYWNLFYEQHMKHVQITADVGF